MRTSFLVMIAALLAAPLDARRDAAPPDFGVITLDRADPAVAATVAGVPVRLAVTLNIGLYLTAATAVRLPLAWRKGEPEQVGRVRIAHREAAGETEIGGAAAAVLMQTQDEPCCEGHDGAISAAELPWSTVLIGDAGGPAERRFPLENDERSGLSVPWMIGGGVVHLVLAPDVAETVVTASAAALIAETNGGHLKDAARDVVVAYGVARTMRDMALDRPIDPLGFRLDHLAVRVGDFVGDTSLPDPIAANGADDEIIVRHKRLPPQFRWPAITIGRDVLGRCPGIAFYRGGNGAAPSIGLSCTR